jgi:hypothetical protein
MRRLLVIVAALAVAPVANAGSFPPIKHPVRAAAGYQSWLNQAYDARYRCRVFKAQKNSIWCTWTSYDQGYRSTHGHVLYKLSGYRVHEVVIFNGRSTFERTYRLMNAGVWSGTALFGIAKNDW